MRYIVVSSNCQTAGIAATLSEIFPKDRIHALPMPALNNMQEELEFVRKIKAADVWVSMGHYDLIEKHGLKEMNPDFQLVKAPPIGFPAFHPDLCYAKKVSTGELIVPHYNSAIVVWSYKNNIAPKDAEKLFNYRTYKELGYLDIWTPSVTHLKKVFANYGWEEEFDNFFLHVKRTGSFMYSVNHPKVHALVRLGKMLATRMGSDKSIYDRELDINDGLTDVVWPTYPEIADELGVETTGYSWRMGGHNRFPSISRYVEFAYNIYRGQGVRCDDISIAFFDASKLDAVLSPQVGI
jgi:hypothetical protein